jgi:small GTP-binding protein
MTLEDSGSSTIIFPVIKVVVAGDAGVGKSSLIRRYCTDTFDESRVATNAMDFQIKIEEIEGRSIKLSIWDIAGQEKFGAFRDTFYRGAKAIALVYDLTQPTTMENLPRWHAEIAHICSTAHFLVIGNKSDLERQGPHDPVQAWAAGMGFPYAEASALSGANVNEAFMLLAQLAIARKK